MGVNRLWYRKKATTKNIKLRQAIIDALPFDVDVEKADLILDTILDAITKGVKRDRKVVITGLGVFTAKYRAPRLRYIGIATNFKKGIVKPYKGYYHLHFTPCQRLRLSLRDKEDA